MYFLIIVIIFMGLGGTYRLEEDFKVIKPQRVGFLFIGGVNHSKHQVKSFIGQLEEG